MSLLVSHELSTTQITHPPHMLYCQICCVSEVNLMTSPSAEATKRGLGSALLRKPPKLARLVAGIAEGIELPLTVKVRTGTSYSKINAQEVSGAFCQAVTWA